MAQTGAGSHALKPLEVIRTDTRLLPDPSRVIAKRFMPVNEVFPNGRTRIELVVERILAMSDRDVEETTKSIRSKFSDRHRDLGGFSMQASPRWLIESAWGTICPTTAGA
jgi:hypothetical protein